MVKVKADAFDVSTATWKLMEGIFKCLMKLEAADKIPGKILNRIKNNSVNSSNFQELSPRVKFVWNPSSSCDSKSFRFNFTILNKAYDAPL